MDPNAEGGSDVENLGDENGVPSKRSEATERRALNSKRIFRDQA